LDGGFHNSSGIYCRRPGEFYFENLGAVSRARPEFRCSVCR
jgi:hypothetical protein